MGFCQLVPNIRVNYSFSDILRAWFIGNSGKYTHFLEESLADLFQVEDVLLTSSGRSALYHLLTYLPQRKVIVMWWLKPFCWRIKKSFILM